MGPQGAQGVQGAQGANNPTVGAPGILGASGQKGAPGTTEPGSTGAQGAEGNPGFKGAQGAQGAQGDTGPSVTCYLISIWEGNDCADVCAGTINPGNYFSQNASCMYSGCYFDTEQDCIDTTYNYSGKLYFSCDGPPAPPTCGTLNANGCVISQGSCRPSDERLKRGIETLKNSLEKLMMIDAVEYDWNNKLREYDSFKEQEKLHTIGLIAQEVREYFPQIISINPEGYYWIDYNKLNAVLVEAIKEQQVFIEDIDKELEFIESKLKYGI